jgi:tellurium resistance protein TerD
MQTLSLEKGANLSLTKAAPNMKNAIVGLGWKVRRSDGVDYDLDASLVLLDRSGKVRSDKDFIYYNQEKSECGSIVHMGDNQEGSSESGDVNNIETKDSESVSIALNNVPLDIDKIIVAVTIHEAEKHRLNFGQIDGAYVRIIDADNKVVVAKYDLSEDAGVETSMIFCEIYRHNNEWKIKAVEQGYKSGLRELAIGYGVKL